MHFYGFLNRKLKEVKHEIREKGIIRVLPVTMDELDLKWEDEGPERLRL